MFQLIFAIICALALQTLSAAAQTPGNPKRAPNLSCTFISKQCRIGCVKEAPEQFCNGYCLDTKAACLKTGRWDGIRRRYWGVQKR